MHKNLWPEMNVQLHRVCIQVLWGEYSSRVPHYRILFKVLNVISRKSSTYNDKQDGFQMACGLVGQGSPIKSVLNETHSNC